MESDGSSSSVAASSFDYSMSVEELAYWLNQKGIPLEFCETFEGQFISHSKHSC